MRDVGKTFLAVLAALTMCAVLVGVTKYVSCGDGHANGQQQVADAGGNTLNRVAPPNTGQPIDNQRQITEGVPNQYHTQRMVQYVPVNPPTTNGWKRLNPYAGMPGTFHYDLDEPYHVHQQVEVVAPDGSVMRAYEDHRMMGQRRVGVFQPGEGEAAEADDAGPEEEEADDAGGDDAGDPQPEELVAR